MCDAPECKDVLNITGNTERDKSVSRSSRDGWPRSGSRSRAASSPTRTSSSSPEGEDAVQQHGGLGEGLRGCVHVLPLPLRRTDDHAGLLLQRAARRADRGPGEGDRDRLPEDRSRAWTPTSTRASRSRMTRADELLGRSRQEGHGRDRSVGAVDLAELHEHDQQRGHQVGLRPVDRHAGLAPGRRRPVEAELDAEEGGPPRWGGPSSQGKRVPRSDNLEGKKMS